MAARVGGQKMPRLLDFEGRWRLSRKIADALGPDAVFEGTATFRRDADGLHLREAGQLELAGQGRFQAERAYLWREDDEEIVVLFADGRDFHRFGLLAGQARADHWCDPDTYKVSYDFTDWPVWRAEWRVTGPRKDYVMLSEYRPESGISVPE